MRTVEVETSKLTTPFCTLTMSRFDCTFRLEISRPDELNSKGAIQVLSNPAVLHCWLAISTISKLFSTLQVLQHSKIPYLIPEISPY
jgi:hypothetical protein